MQDIADRRAGIVAPGTFIEWGPVIGGAIVGTAVASVLLAFAGAIGLLVASPSPSWRDASVWLTILSGVWLLLVYVFSFGIGGYVAGRLRSPLTEADPNEIEFRDGMHGLLAWGLGVIIGALLLWAAVTALSSTRSGTTPTSGEPGYLTSELDRLFRSDGRPRDGDVQSRREEAARLINSGLGRQGLAGDDRTYLVQLVAMRTGLSPADADRRVTQVMESAREATKKARRIAVITGFMTATALLAGAAAAWVFGRAGGRQRDGETVPALFAMSWRPRELPHAG